MYELEGKNFVRISSSGIINLSQSDHSDTLMSGTVLIRMKDNSTVSVSRRCLTKVKKILGLQEETR